MMQPQDALFILSALRQAMQDSRAKWEATPVEDAEARHNAKAEHAVARHALAAAERLAR